MPIVLHVVSVVDVVTGQRVFTPLRGVVSTGKTKPGRISHTLPIAHTAIIVTGSLHQCPCTRTLGRRRVLARHDGVGKSNESGGSNVNHFVYHC